MNPVAFSIFGLDIRWYGVLIASGMILGVIISQINCNIRNLDKDLIINMFIISLPFAIIGARLYYVIFNWGYYSANLIDIPNIRQGGLAIHGGVICALLAVFIYARIKKIDVITYVDTAAPSIIIGQAIGRWGNFFNQEAHGGVVSYSFIKHFPLFIQKGMNIDGVYYHPTFLYESIWDLFVFVLLMIILRKSNKIGIVIASYIGLYSIGRYFIEGLRTDSLMIGPFRTAQIVSLVGIILWISYLLFSYIKVKSKESV